MRELCLHVAKRVVGSATFMEAVRRNQSTPRWSQARETSDRILGTVVEDGCWEDDRLAVLLSDDCALYFVAGLEVGWQLVSKSQFDAFRSSWTSDSEPIRSKLQCVDGRVLTNDMDREGIIARLIGRRIRRIVVDDFGTYLHFQGDRRYLALHAQIVTGTDLPFLFWFEDKD